MLTVFLSVTDQKLWGNWAICNYCLTTWNYHLKSIHLKKIKENQFVDLYKKTLSVVYSIRLYFHHHTHPQLGIVFCFDSGSSFFLELLLHSSPVAYWTPTDLGRSSFSVIPFCFFIHSWVLKARMLKWFAIPFSNGQHLIRIMTHPSWVALHSMAHSFIECCT